MKVSEVMTQNPIRVYRNTSAQEIARLMETENVGSVLVVTEDDELLGIITERMMVLEVVAPNRSPSEVKAEEIMWESAISVPPEMDINKAAVLLEELEIRYLPVIEKGKVIGILSVSDLAGLLSDLVDCVFAELKYRRKKRLDRD
jgi:signal-transduction protein with cAMP-binding, CBS, and nucleotidyltransferase domain